MATQEDQTSDDPEIERIRGKSQEGALNVIGDVLNDPRVQQIIKKALLRETIKNTIFLTCFLIGFLKLYEVAKTVIDFDWVVDLLISVILILIGLIYLLKTLYNGSESDGDRQASSGNP